MKKIYTFLSILIIFSSCVSPEQALDKKWYKTALKLAAKKIKKGEDVEKNIRILQTAADHIVAEELEKRKNLVNSPKVHDWIRVQDSYYKVLEVLGKANIDTEGAVLHSYDEMCSIKKDLDFKIVDYYYQKGERAMEKFYYAGQKKDSRYAYYEYIKAKNHGGNIYYNNLDDLIEESHKNGIVYYIGDYSVVGSSLFLKPLPQGSDLEPDCEIYVDVGSISFSESTSSSTDTYNKEIVVGKEEVKDTSGNITYRDVTEEVNATVTTVVVTVTASAWTSVSSTDLSGQCTVSGTSFCTSVSDDYKEIFISGDKRALPSGITEETGAPVFLRSNLESELRRKIDSELFSVF